MYRGLGFWESGFRCLVSISGSLDVPWCASVSLDAVSRNSVVSLHENGGTRVRTPWLLNLELICKSQICLRFGPLSAGFRDLLSLLA